MIPNKHSLLFLIIMLAALLLSNFSNAGPIQIIVIPDTGQSQCFNNKRAISYPFKGSSFFGQDAHYQSHPMAYRDNGDGTITDLVTGLMWSKAVDPQKVSLDQAQKLARSMTLGNHTDWRVPTIKELYSLINYSGSTGLAGRGNLSSAIPFINTDYFDFRYGDVSSGERYIDAQWLSSTTYVSTTMGGARTLFGVNFADGRIKGYGYSRPNSHRPEKKFFVRFVRGTPNYGTSNFIDNGNGTITDRTTRLMWMKSDSKTGMNWEQALSYAENMDYAGYDDWRLPNAKELQYIVDYTRSPDTSNSAAINPIFNISSIKNESNQIDYPYFWTSTTHLEGPHPGTQGVYISFGRAMGKMHGQTMDVHGAGAQRSDPKSGRGNISRGPQGDWIRVTNYVRLVRGGSIKIRSVAPEISANAYPNKIKIISAQPFSNDSHGLNSPSDSFSMPQMGNRPGQPNQMDSSRPNAPNSGVERFINRLDRNGDNKVSRSEFDGPASHFGRFDKNNDGYITADEAPTGPPPGHGRH